MGLLRCPVQSRSAKIGDKLITRNFGTGSRGFAAPEDTSVAVCLLPGTELSFVEEVASIRLWPWSKVVKHKTAIFHSCERVSKQQSFSYRRLRLGLRSHNGSPTFKFTRRFWGMAERSRSKRIGTGASPRCLRRLARSSINLGGCARSRPHCGAARD